MPVTIKPGTAHCANEVKFPYEERGARDEVKISAEQFLVHSGLNDYFNHFVEILQSSYKDLVSETVRPSGNGFVNATMRACRKRHSLVIRPEDVWFSILSQLNFYIRAQSGEHHRELRELFIKHGAKMELEVQQPHVGFDHGIFATKMTKKIAKSFKEPSRQWIMPAFSTTTATDTLVASILMMGAMTYTDSEYLYPMNSGQLPSVQILGEKQDWEMILGKLDFLAMLGSEAKNFQALLIPILKRFVRSFECPDSEDIKEFWRDIWRSEDDSLFQISGWMTAFCHWDKDGKVQVTMIRFGDELSLSTLDGVLYGMIGEKHIPQGYTSVPVTVKVAKKLYFKARMIAGSVGVEAIASGEGENSEVKDTLRPLSGWSMFGIEDGSDGETESPDGHISVRLTVSQILETCHPALFGIEDGRDGETGSSDDDSSTASQILETCHPALFGIEDEGYRETGGCDDDDARSTVSQISESCQPALLAG